MKRIIAWFVGHGVAANLLMVGLVVGGLVAAPTIPRKLMPDIDIGIVGITVPYPGAAPEEVEQGVCIPVEEAIESITGIERIRTSATEGSCTVSAELYDGVDEDDVANEVRSQVEGIQNFPDEAEKPIVAKFEFKRSVVDLAVSGKVGEEALKRIGERIRDEIVALPEVTQVELLYSRASEISIEVSEESLRRYGMSFDDVANAVRSSSLDLPGGAIKAAGGEILLRSKAQAYRGEEFERLVVMTRADGTRVLLSDVATVVDGFEQEDLAAAFDGRPAVIVRALRVGDEDVIGISSAVHAYVAEARARLPAGVKLTVWSDNSTMVRGRLDTLYRNGAGGLVLVFIVLSLFLRFRLAVWTTLGVPIALLGALLCMPFIGASFDQVTLFAFILVLGILVDDAIVVAENVYTNERRLGDRVQAAIRGTQEVATPVIFGVLTTVAAFFPLLVIPGRMGQIFSFMGLTVVACLIFSLVESQFVLPSHLSHGRALGGAARQAGRLRQRWEAFQNRFSEGLQHFIEERYRPFLHDVLRWRYTAVATGIALLILTVGVVQSGRVKFNFFPAVEADYVAAQLTMPQGTAAAETRRALDAIVASSWKLQGRLDAEFARDDESLVLHRLVSIGRRAFVQENTMDRSSGGHVGEVVLELLPSEKRKISTGEIARRWSELTGDVPGAKDLTFASDLFSAGAPIDIQLRGPESVSLPEAAAFLKEKLAIYPGVYDIADSFLAGKRELRLEILPEAEPLGVTMQDLARQTRQAFYGEEVQRIQRGRDDVKVMVRYPEEERRSLANLDELRIRTRQGAEVPFWSVARVSPARGYADIRRTDRQRTVNVTADVDTSRVTANEVMADLHANVLPELERRFPGVGIGKEGELEDQSKAFGGLLAGYPLAMLAVFALLAIPLNSYIQPLIIMSVIPFGIVGAVAGHLLTGRTLSFPSIMGIVALSGVVVNASLVLVVKVNRLRGEGRPLREAVVEGAASRFRPIVLTAVTTFVGLTPLMLEGSLQAQILIPMAISLAFGVLFATVITLVVVPCGYLILEDLARLWSRPRRRRPRPVQLNPRDEAA
ncbi:MAG: efflux RND transporter permease subunit [Myxococcota bacterium]